MANSTAQQEQNTEAWTPEEDSKLLWYKKLDLMWRVVAKEMNHKTVRQCKERYDKLYKGEIETAGKEPSVNDVGTKKQEAEVPAEKNKIEEVKNA